MTKDNTLADELTLRDRLRHLTDGQLETYHYDELEAFIKQREQAAKKQGFYMAAGLFGVESPGKVEPLWESCIAELAKEQTNDK